MLDEVEVGHPSLQLESVALALPPRDRRMGLARDHVEHLRIPLDDARKSVDNRLEALSG